MRARCPAPIRVPLPPRALVSFVPLLALLVACDGTVSDAARCAPAAGGPYWVEERQTVSFTAACTGTPPPPGQSPAPTWTISALPAGASFDAASGAFTWTPGLDQAAVYTVTVQLGDEAATVKIGVADAFDAPGNTPPQDPLSYGEELGLPVLFLSPAPISSTDYAPADVVFRGHRFTGNVEAKKRGAASLGYPKNSYTIELDRDDPFDAPDLGFPARHKVVLVSTFDDNSYVRQRLAYDVWNRLDPGHIQIASSSVVVYLDGVYWGLYTLVDHFDDDLAASQGMAPTVNVYKAVTHDANFRLVGHDGQGKTTLHDGYEKKDGLPPEGQPGAFDDLDALVMWAATADAPTFAAQRATRLDTRDYEDWWIFVTLILADDSAGKNSFHAHDPAGGPFRYVPWDFNNSFGQTWETAREAADLDEDYASMNRLFERFLADPTIAGPMRARYAAALAGPLAKDVVLGLVDGYVAQIDAGARRDQRRWGQAYRDYAGWSFRDDFTTYDQELAYVRAWIAARWAHVAAGL